MSEHCRHWNWLPLVCHRGLWVRVCLNCGLTRMDSRGAA